MSTSAPSSTSSCASREAAQKWQEYQLISDVLRGGVPHPQQQVRHEPLGRGFVALLGHAFVDGDVHQAGVELLRQVSYRQETYRAVGSL